MTLFSRLAFSELVYQKSLTIQTNLVISTCSKSAFLSNYFRNLKCQTFQSRHYNSYKAPLNTVVMFVPQQEAWVVERMGRFHTVLQPGLNLLIPILDKVKYVQVLKEQAIKIPEQSAVTRDNVGLHIDGVLYVRVDDPYKASYGVEDPEYAVTQLAQTTMRSEIVLYTDVTEIAAVGLTDG